MKISTTSLATAALALGCSSAERDSNFYGAYQNPNSAYDHYWADAKYVLEDLSAFDRLYVRYENCAWSVAKYTDDDFDDDGDDGGRRRRLDDDNQCGGNSDSEDYWWIGMGECKQPNIAYSLYGVLAGEQVPGPSFYGLLAGEFGMSPCSKSTYINSFFTFDGLRSFVAASKNKVNTSEVSQYCSSYSEGDDDGSGDGNSGSGDGDGSYYYTTGCSAAGNFTVDTFTSSSCHGAYYNATLYNMDELNESFDDLTCEQIYDSDGSMDYASTLLYYSEACSIDGQYKDFCPDPYGLLTKYEYNFAMSQVNSSFVANLYTDTYVRPSIYQLPIVEVFSSCVFILCGAWLLQKGLLKNTVSAGNDSMPKMLADKDAVYA